MKAGALASRYAEALFAAADEAGISAEIGAELESLGQHLAEDAGFRNFVLDKSMASPRKKEIFQAMLGEALQPYVLNFFYLLFDKDREGLLTEIIGAYRGLHQQKLGLLPAQLTTAKPISEQDMQALSAALSKAYEQQIVFERHVDPALLGGAVISIGDTTIDGSLKSGLNSLRKQLLAC